MTRSAEIPPPVLCPPVTVTDLPGNGRVVRLKADAETRARVAAFLDLPAIDRLSVEAELKPRGRGLTVSGRVQARVVQTCVVSLAPVTGQVDEAFRVRFVPPGRADRGGAPDIEPTGDDPPETLVGDSVDLSAIVLEHLSLGLDPFPRAAEAEPPAPLGDPDPPEEADSASGGKGPFAALARLRSDG
ncbi:YceD family protein [Roseospirillum parvum]|uniref:Uncharacterized metal-binding protein YceD, DUF177 family n=1 Tax=Roseospirillum parvum TaxID=83401 RepID=A0A1G7YCD0_9PROT|nr:DUF177 domain-containing protein [Roseospirillum parvum]SDG94044.1 Uncharacterized metal-binding protein YceD, DUF177 family [Roseospirillum parvum]